MLPCSEIVPFSPIFDVNFSIDGLCIFGRRNDAKSIDASESLQFFIRVALVLEREVPTGTVFSNLYEIRVESDVFGWRDCHRFELPSGPRQRSRVMKFSHSDLRVVHFKECYEKNPTIDRGAFPHISDSWTNNDKFSRLIVPPLFPRSMHHVGRVVFLEFDF